MSSHSNNFDFVRICAALSVVLSHHFALSRHGEPVVLKYQTLGGFGVLIFFAISGFLVALSWQRDPSPVRFFQRRFLRIWPGLLCTVAICALIIGPMVTTDALSDYFASPTFYRYFQNLIFSFQPFLPGVFATSPYPYSMNGVLWTIPLEFACYVLLCFLGSVGLFRFRHGLHVTWIALFIWYYISFGVEARVDSGGQRMYFIEYASFFFAGAIFALHVEALTSWRLRMSVLILSALVSIGAYALDHQLIAALAIVPSFFIVLGMSSTPGLREFGRYGDPSYGIYIYAYPIQQCLIWKFPSLQFWASLGVAIFLTMIVAYFSWHFVEKRALQFKPKQAFSS